MNNTVKIFILDDDRFFGKFVKYALNEKFSDVTYFQSEYECIRSLHEKPQILILDHQLENCTGLEVITEVQRICGNNTHILYISAQEHVHVTIKALRSGAVEYLEKGNSTIQAIANSIEKIERLTDSFTVPLNVKEYRGQM